MTTNAIEPRLCGQPADCGLSAPPPAARTLVVLAGPTGVGKTELSLKLAQAWDTCILSADSRQMYAGLEIGTAAPTQEQLGRVPHFFVGTLHVTDSYSAARYETDVMDLLPRLWTEHRVVLLSGGSMMYIDAVCQGIDDMPTVDADTRATLMARYEAEGLERMCAELRLLDPEYYHTVDLKNPRRVLHALEICYLTGKPYSLFRRRQPKARPFRIVKIGLERPRPELYARIDSRVDQMMADGLQDEARRMLPYRTCNALNTVGYKELFSYFDGECTLDEAVAKIKQHTRIYSRKQMTWFKRDATMHWFHPDDEAGVLAYVSAQLGLPPHQDGPTPYASRHSRSICR